MSKPRGWLDKSQTLWRREMSGTCARIAERRAMRQLLCAALSAECCSSMQHIHHAAMLQAAIVIIKEKLVACFISNKEILIYYDEKQFVTRRLS